MPYAQLHLEAIDHEKIVLHLPDDKVRWTWVVAIVRGKLRKPAGQWASLEHMQISIGRPLKHLQLLLAARLLDQAEDGSVRLHDWSDWQSGGPNDPTAAERMRRYRERQKGATGVTVTCNRYAQRNGQNKSNVKEDPPPPPSATVTAPDEGGAEGADFSNLPGPDRTAAPSEPAALTRQQLEAAAELRAHDVQIAEDLVREFPDLTTEIVREEWKRSDDDAARLVKRIRTRPLLSHRKAPPPPKPRPTFRSEDRSGNNAGKPLSSEEIRAAIREANPAFAAKLEKHGGTP